jgi:sugar phosphate isomerase/epimerase
MLGHVHIKDARRVNGETVATAVGEGAVDYKGIFGKLKEIGYDGDIMLETHYRIAGEIDEKTLKNPKGSAISDGGYAPSCLCMENLLKLLGRD